MKLLKLTMSNNIGKARNHVFAILYFLSVNYCSVGQTLFDNDKAPEKINYKSYSELDGLSSNGICVLYQDTAGFLWVGTSNGLNRFDGTTFKKYFARIPNYENSLTDNYIHSITQYQHYLLVGTLKGISVFNLKSEQFENNYLLENFKIENEKERAGFYKVDNYFALITDFTFTLYTSNLKLLHTTDYSNLKKTNNRFYFGSQMMRILSGNKLQIQISGGYQYLDLVTYKLSHIDTIPTGEAGDFKYQHITNKTLNRDSLIFKTQWNSNLSFMDNQSKILYQIIVNDSCRYCGDNSQVNQILKVGKHSILAATGSGLLFYNFKSGIKKTYAINKENETDINQCGQVLRDKENNIWIGTQHGLYEITNGLNKFNVNTIDVVFDSITPLNKILENKENEKVIFEVNSSNIWFITNNKVSSIKYQMPFKSEQVINAIQINGNEYLIASWQGLFSFFRKENLFKACEYVPDSARKQVCWGLLKDQHNNVWMGFGGGMGLYRYNIITKATKHFSQYSYPSTDARYIPIRNAMSIVEIDEQHIAFANNQTQCKLCIWNATTDIISVINAANVQNEFEPYHGPVNNMIADNRKNVWLATYNGIISYNLVNNTFKLYDKAEGLENSNTYAIAFDNKNNLWVGTKSGLYVLNANTGIFKNFKDDNTVNQLQIEYLFYDSTTHYMFVFHSNQILSFNPESLYTNTNQSKTYFEAIYLNQQPISIDHDTIFNNNENNFQFNIGALNLSDGIYNKFYYQLIPIDTSWQPLEYQRQINFANLLPGDYTFKVTTINNDGVWGIPVKYHFNIARAFYQTWWFISLIILTIGLICYLIFKFRFDQLQKLYVLRNRLSRDLHDDIGSTLSSINILSRTAQKNVEKTGDEKTKASLEKINERSQRLLDNMSDIIWNINPGNDTIEEVMSRMREYATTMLEAKNIDYTFNFPNEKMDCKLSMELKSNMYLIFKEGVNNLSKYSNATKANLSFTFDEKSIHLKIEDNGKGFNEDEIKHRGGLSNMQHRAEEIKGAIIINSVVGKGTTIELTMPRY